MQPIKLFRGDDTHFNDGKLLVFHITGDTDLSAFSGMFSLGRFKKPVANVDGTFEVVIPAEWTQHFALGPMQGTFQLVDGKMRVATVSNTIPFEITDQVFTLEPETVELPVPAHYPVQLSLEIGFAGGNYNQLNNLPTYPDGTPITGTFDINKAGAGSAQAVVALQETVAQHTADIAAQGSALSAETLTRETADTSLQANITAEAQARAGAVTQVQTALTNEAERAQVAEADLQGQIDGLSAAQNVHDIVGTYADLQSYDTSSLPANEIIKVLVDSTHTNAASYYNWTGSVWQYIGSEGPYSTPGETAAAALQATDNANAYTDNKVSTLATQAAVTALETSKLSKTEAAGTYETQTHAAATYVPLSQKAAANGVATLDNTGKITAGQIPYATSARVGGIKQSFDATTGTWTVITEEA